MSPTARFESLHPGVSFQEVPWRLGRKRKDNIYAMVGDAPSDQDMPVAVTLGSSGVALAFAARIVRDHNELLEKRERDG